MLSDAPRSRPRRRRTWQVPATPGTRLDRRQNVIGFWSATRRFRRLELRFLSPRPRPFGKRHANAFRERSRSPRSFFMILSDRPDSPDDEAQLTVRHYDFRVKLLKRKGKAIARAYYRSTYGESNTLGSPLHRILPSIDVCCRFLPAIAR